MSEGQLTHLDAGGQPRMVDVTDKPITPRRAVAAGCIRLGPANAAALERASAGDSKKGDPWSVARIGAIQGAKRAADLIPLAHPLVLTGITIEHQWHPEAGLAWMLAEVRTEGRTGVEMEALAAVSSGLLTLYDMLKAAGQEMELGPVRLLLKEGGRSGVLQRPWPECPFIHG